MSNAAYEFWKRVDAVRVTPLSELASFACVSYKNIKDQRSLLRLPKLEDAFKLAQALNVSLEFLLTGKGEEFCLSPEAKLVDQDEELKALVRAISHDRRLLSAISAVVRSYEVKVN